MMHRVPYVRWLTFFCVCIGTAVEFSPRGNAVAKNEAKLQLNESRTNSSDLEVRGVDGKGLPQYVTRASIEALPQVDAVVSRDENFTEMPKEGAAVRGVDVDVLSRALGVPSAMAAEAVAIDGYATTYPAAYRKQHHPIFVLTVEGTTPKVWAEKTHTSDQGPYFIAYDHFVPAFRVLSHEDRAQVPVQVVRLEFAAEERMFAGIRPGARADLPTAQGYRIAQQNCFRCHNAAGYGGAKSGRSWQMLAKDARERPAWFAKWVHNPQEVDAKAEMPPNLEYDRATLSALTRYFSTIR